MRVADGIYDYCRWFGLRSTVGNSLGGVIVAGALVLCAVCVHAQSSFKLNVNDAIDGCLQYLRDHIEPIINERKDPAAEAGRLSATGDVSRVYLMAAQP